MTVLRRQYERFGWNGVIAAVTFLAIVAGAAAHVFGAPALGDGIWAGAIVLVLAPLVLSVARTLLAGDLGVDAIALVAMAGALALGEYLAGAVIALMLSGGNALEHVAARRARHELTQLVARAPATARRREDDHYVEIPADDVRVGDVVLVRSGEVVPVDGVPIATATVDESALTGEPLPVERGPGELVRSGVANAGPPFELRTVRAAADSAYAAIVRLVTDAEARKAPFLRMADRYAAGFLPLTIGLAAVAWAISGSPTRALAVVVIATPCPLILAAPIALISGMSRAARLGVILKGSQVVEQLGRARTMLLDKTGTVTTGEPTVERVEPSEGRDADDVLRVAASLDQLSPHVLARALVRGASARGLDLAMPDDASEEPGHGMSGRVDGRRVAVGSARWVAAELAPDAERPRPPPVAQGMATIGVAVDGAHAGWIVMGDHLRPDAALLVESLRQSGFVHVALVTGDHRGVADEIGHLIGVDVVYADQTPLEKAEVVRQVRATIGGPVVMVGDGINDAPALAVADIGVAIGAAGATVSSEAADAVVMVDRVDRIGAAVGVSRRALGIARQSVLIGLGLSLAGMVFAAAGFIAPVAGALLQEGIDVAVILNALRARRDPGGAIARIGADRAAAGDAGARPGLG